MELEFEQIDAEEYAELHHRYAPLAAAVRDLVHASLSTGAGSDTMREAVAAIAAVTETLRGEGQQHPMPMLRHRESGRPVVWSNPVTGFRNPLAPPLSVAHESDGRFRSEFSLGAPYEGPPGRVHGGICALILDQVLGEAATTGLTEQKFTGTISLRYLRGTPLGALRAEAWVDRVEGHKTFVRGFIADAEGPTVEAEGVFITPAWARANAVGETR